MGGSSTVNYEIQTRPSRLAQWRYHSAYTSRTEAVNVRARLIREARKRGDEQFDARVAPARKNRKQAFYG
jgi:hypothetical protein